MDRMAPEEGLRGNRTRENVGYRGQGGVPQYRTKNRKREQKGHGGAP